jgi:hypothetical protein
LVAVGIKKQKEGQNFPFERVFPGKKGRKLTRICGRDLREALVVGQAGDERKKNEKSRQ